MLQTSVCSFQALSLSDLISWIYLSLQGIWFRSYLNGLVVFPTFFSLSLNLAIWSSWSKSQWAPGLFCFSFFGCKEYNQSDIVVDYLVMFMYSIFPCVVGRCLLWPVCSLGKTLLSFALLHFVLQGLFGHTCYSRCFLTSYFCIPVPCNEKDIFLGASSRRSCKSS